MSQMNAEPLYPVLLHRYADEFGRLEVPVNFLDETLSVLYTFHDPENTYTLTAKMAEFAFTYRLHDNEEKMKAALSLFLNYYHSISMLIDEIELDYNLERCIKKLTNISKAILDIHGGTTEENRTAVRHWMSIILRGVITRFKIPTSSSKKMSEYVENKLSPGLAKSFNLSVALLGKIGSEEGFEESDLELAVSVLFILTSKVHDLRKTALDMMERGEMKQ